MLAKLAAGAVGVAGDVPYREGPLLVFGLIGCAALWDQGLSHSHRPYPITYGVGAYSNPHNGAYGYVRGAYGPYGGVAGGAWYNPSTGTGGRAVGACGPYGCAGAARAYNPYTGAYGATRQGSNAYSQWGSSVVTKGDKWAQTGHYTDSRGAIAGARTSEGGRVVAGSGQNGSGSSARAAQVMCTPARTVTSTRKQITAGNSMETAAGTRSTRAQHDPEPQGRRRIPPLPLNRRARLKLRRLRGGRVLPRQVNQTRFPH
jgi:hypothetical protein